jgi:hypothetical protein
MLLSDMSNLSRFPGIDLCSAYQLFLDFMDRDKPDENQQSK